MKRTTRLFLLSWGLVWALAAAPAAAAELFRDEMTSSTGWAINQGPDTDSGALFGINYSSYGIPEAPNTVVGDTATTGMLLEANNFDANPAGAFLTAYPVGQNFTGNYRLRFDQWMNYDAVERNEGGSVGTTEFMGGGIGYDGVTADVGSGAQAIVTGDEGSGSDWRAFKGSHYIASTAMAGGSRNGAIGHYADFLPPVEVPAAQGQTGANDPQMSFAGTPGFQWITWEFAVAGDQVSIVIEKPDGSRLDIVSYDATDTSDGSSGVSTDGNISIFYADFFSSIATNAELTFGIVDNVVVDDEVSLPATPGDFDMDTDVDGDDLGLWQSHFGVDGGADADDDDDTDGGDFVLWQRNFAPPVLTATQVPEPTTAVLLIAGLAAAAAAKRVRRRA